MTRKDLENLVFQMQVADQSVAWLKQKMEAVVREVAVIEATQPIDFELLQLKEREFEQLKSRNLMEKKITNALYAKFESLPKNPTTGQYKVPSK
jgi:hypothetical protein